ncbi:MAG: ZIP family metal transporter [Chloroflexota bacterium]|nr:ZIP family metal transporter [Chloroflexota bacterium]MDP3046166.1 ZIP family metal transporter [Chloroflexota bacterium]
MPGHTVILEAALVSLIASLGTGFGGVLIAFIPRFDMRIYDTLLGFAAGVMTSIATIGLIGEALTRGDTAGALLGVSAGAAALFALDRLLPHEHTALSFDCTDVIAYRRGILLLSALTLHHLPEGLAVGTSYAAQPHLGLLLAMAIALHNIPEGMAVAGPFRACGMPRRQYLGWAFVSGLAEPVAALIGAAAVGFFQAIVPFSLAFAGGAMLYVVSDELIPESHSHGFEHEATFGFLFGFVLLLALSGIMK